ncbi:hypothetical protein FB451DRAFT_1400643 [Mycena latifolia]|nr:hypothetical protein FB451DRAFT_1400643 [Mycena latifolia]
MLAVLLNALGLIPAIMNALRFLLNAGPWPLVWHFRLFVSVFEAYLAVQRVKLRHLFSSREVQSKAIEALHEARMPVGVHPFRKVWTYTGWVAIYVSQFCFEQGRITVPPAVVLVANRFYVNPALYASSSTSTAPSTISGPSSTASATRISAAAHGTNRRPTRPHRLPARRAPRFRRGWLAQYPRGGGLVGGSVRGVLGGTDLHHS